jgi:ABC-type transport system substrate-binding protein
MKYNIVRAQDPKDGAGQFANQAKWFTSIDTTDKYTAILATDQPRPLVFDFFEYFNMVDRDTVEGPNAKTTTVGTGPFTFVEWVPGDHLAFAKNTNYWQTGRPYLDGVHGVGQAQDLPWLPGSPAYEASKQDVYPFDMEKAKTLLDQAGVSQIEMDMLFTASAEANVLTQIYQADLAKLGIKMNIKVSRHRGLA